MEQNGQNGGNYTILLICIIIGGIIIIGIIVFFLRKYVFCKGRSKDEINQQLFPEESNEIVNNS